MAGIEAMRYGTETNEPHPASKCMLEAVSITKDFPGVRALEDVSFSLEEGRIYGLVGENGAGKSTLLSILQGVYAPTSGEVRIRGEKAEIKGPSQARKEYGIDGVFQSPISIPTLTVAENLFLGEESAFYRNGVIDFRRLHNKAREIVSALGLNVDVELPGGRLSSAELKLVELARVLNHNPQIVILDEVTASLERDDVEKLFRILRDLRNAGKTCIFVSHRLREIMEIADECVVLRGGRLAGRVKTENVEDKDLIELMTGQKQGLSFPSRTRKSEKEMMALSLRDLAAVEPTRLKNVNLDLRKGEIVALAGLRGQGQSELLKCTYGLIPGYRGHIYLGGREAKISKPIDAIKHGMIRVSDDKEKDELCLTLSVLRNIAFASLSGRSGFQLMDLKRENNEAEKFLSMFRIQTPSLHQQVMNLSGGNKQKVVLAKWMRVKPQVMLADEPTKGLDVGAKMEVYRILRDLANEGLSILTILTELEEVLNLPDRILVMREGEIVREFVGEGLREDELLRSYYAEKGQEK